MQAQLDHFVEHGVDKKCFRVVPLVIWTYIVKIQGE